MKAVICDKCEGIIEGEPWVIKLNFEGRHFGEWDICDKCWDKFGLLGEEEEEEKPTKPTKKYSKRGPYKTQTAKETKTDPDQLYVRFTKAPMCRL